MTFILFMCKLWKQKSRDITTQVRVSYDSSFIFNMAALHISLLLQLFFCLVFSLPTGRNSICGYKVSFGLLGEFSEVFPCRIFKRDSSNLNVKT